MVMAELVRQVTSSCAERGHALAATWNLHIGLTDALTGALAMAPIPRLNCPQFLFQMGEEASLIRSSDSAVSRGPLLSTMASDLVYRAQCVRTRTNVVLTV